MNSIQIPAGMQTKYFVMSRGALADVPELLNTAFPGKKVWLIADDNTWKAAGFTVYQHLKAAHAVLAEPNVFPGTPKLHPDYAISRQLAAQIDENTVPVAVGSGVLNDLTKCAAGLAKVPYCCVATAASVDGYTSQGGAMSVDGMKKTVQCAAPYALLADLDVLEQAPPEMLSSGYADLLTKIVAGADWLIAAGLDIEPVRKDVWDLVQKDLRAWLSSPHDLNGIFMGLSATGYAMQLYIDSRPASGAEHLMSHIWEMEHLSVNGEEVSHGFKVGIGTIATTQLLDFIVRTPLEVAKELAAPVQTRAEREAGITELLKKGCCGSGFRETAMSKYQEGEAGLARRKLIYERWDAIRTALRGQLYSLYEVRQKLRDAGAPVHFREIGLDRTQYLHAVRAAQLIRKRYTCLDLLYDAGLLDAAIAEIE